MRAAVAGDGSASRRFADIAEAGFLQSFFHRFYDVIGGGGIGDEDQVVVGVRIEGEGVLDIIHDRFEHRAAVFLARSHLAVIDVDGGF